MHMLIYRALENKILFSKINSNFATSVIINLTYTLIIIPPIFLWIIIYIVNFTLLVA